MSGIPTSGVETMGGLSRDALSGSVEHGYGVDGR